MSDRVEIPLYCTMQGGIFFSNKLLKVRVLHLRVKDTDLFI